MDINSPQTNGIPEDNIEQQTPEVLKEFRISISYYVAPTTILRLIEPRAYFAGLIWELEELLKDKDSHMGAEQMRLSEKEYSEEFELNTIKQLFLKQQQEQETFVPDRQLHVCNTLEPIQSPASVAQDTDTLQNKQSIHTSATGGAVNCDELTNHEQHIVHSTAVYQNSLECQKEESRQGTQQASCSATQNAFRLCCNNIECGISTEGSEVSRSENEYTDSFSQDTIVKVEQCKLTEQPNFNNFDNGTLIYQVLPVYSKDINGSSFNICQSPVIHVTTPSYSMLEHST